MRKEITISADINQIETVITFVREQLFEANCPKDTISEMSVVVDEIMANIVNYAYPDGKKGKCNITVCITEEDRLLSVTFADRGIPYDPTKKEDPAVIFKEDLTVDDVPNGGFGIYLVKQFTDQMIYERKDGQNLLTIRKKYGMS